MIRFVGKGHENEKINIQDEDNKDETSLQYTATLWWVVENRNLPLCVFRNQSRMVEYYYKIVVYK